MGVGAECWACVMHVHTHVPCPPVVWTGDSTDCTQYCCAVSVVVSSVCLLFRLWTHALAVFNIYMHCRLLRTCDA